jgi:hypothetical protein
MLKGIHFLLSYACTFECDHCFLYCSPEAKGTFTLSQVKSALAEIKKMPEVNTVFLEGGEPFLFYPLMVESVRLARRQGLKVGIVTNAYWATTAEDAELWLRPLVEIGIDDLSLSDDAFHQPEEGVNTAKMAQQAALKLGLPAASICIETPTVKPAETVGGVKGEPVIGGDVRFRGRAVEKLINGLPLRDPESFTECTDEELERPGRVHIDAYGNVHICQGISMGNMWETPLSQLDAEYDAAIHPICGPLLEGGPIQLAKEHRVPVEEGYVDACHMCYSVRKALIDRFPAHLTPRQVYGLK